MSIPYSVPCPVCQKNMLNTDNPKIVQCERRKVYLEELGAEIDSIHATIYFNEDGKQIIKVIEVGPYSFEIHDDDTIKRTRVTKLMLYGKGKKRRGGGTFERQTLLVVPSIISAPWHDQKMVMDKMKLYSWFL